VHPDKVHSTAHQTITITLDFGRTQPSQLFISIKIHPQKIVS
jgi:hypothetical protein